MQDAGRVYLMVLGAQEVAVSILSDSMQDAGRVYLMVLGAQEVAVSILSDSMQVGIQCCLSKFPKRAS